jgi:hypothetical protein
MIYGETKEGVDFEGVGWNGALSASDFRGHPQSAIFVPSLVKFPLFSSPFSHDVKKKSNKDLSFTKSERNTA